MNTDDFCQLLESVTTLTERQRAIIMKALASEGSDEESLADHSFLLQRIETNFKTRPVCKHCQSQEVRRFGWQSGRQRYQCKTCHKTFNALTETALSGMRLPNKLDAYLICMTDSMTLRQSAVRCRVSLDTSFHLRHRLMRLIEEDQAGLLTGIVEMDETFFRESCKGERNLSRPPRKRGGVKEHSHKRRGSKIERHVKKIPVLTLCNRQQQVVDSMLPHLWWETIYDQIKDHIPQGVPVCADALPQHRVVADKLGLILKELATTAGQHVLEGVFHLQHVNAYHSHLKSWINGVFKGVATKYLNRYLGWRRVLSSPSLLTPEKFREKIAGHWIYQLSP